MIIKRIINAMRFKKVEGEEELKAAEEKSKVVISEDKKEEPSNSK